jgi:hypothetical protein
MWTLKRFKSFAEQLDWIIKNEHRYQINELLINNGYAVEYKPLRIIG